MASRRRRAAGEATHGNVDIAREGKVLRGVLLIGVVGAFGAGIAQGKECKGVSFPDQAQVDGSALTLNGLGLRQATMLKVNVYVAALYVPRTSGDANAILASNG